MILRDQLVPVGSACALMLLAASAASGVVIHDEATNGDLSGDRLNPSAFVLALGTSSILATSVRGDIEYVRFTVPAGTVMSAIVPVAFAGNDTTAFIGVQAGATFTEPPTGTVVGNLLGYTHFGPGPGNIGQDILPSIGTGAGAMGFTPPLQAGDYTFWIQQTGLNPVTYQLDFVVSVPGPGGLAVGSWALVLMGRRRR